MVVENSFSNCNGSSAISVLEAVSPINVIIWNEYYGVSGVSESRATSMYM
jgi:hypothetical protein